MRTSFLSTKILHLELKKIHLITGFLVKRAKSKKEAQVALIGVGVGVGVDLGNAESERYFSINVFHNNIFPS